MKPKNIIYLISDALRPDYLGCYGNKSVLTTEIDKLASDGVLFENVISSAPWTIPSIGTHLTGKYPHRLLLFSSAEKIGKSVKTVFQRFKKTGYKTAAYFDSQKVFEQWSESVDHYARSLDILDLLEFITKNKKKNFFIFNLFRGTHIPYVLKYSKSSWNRSLEEALDVIRYGSKKDIEESKYRYARAVENFSEWYLRAILDRLKDENILDKTAIILTSDHGESWGERYKDKTELDAFKMHGSLLYNDILKVPLVFYNMGKANELKIKNMVRSIDILPTVLDSLKIKYDPKELDGISLKSSLNGKVDRNNLPKHAISSTTSYENPKETGFSVIKMFSIVSGDWKLILNQDNREIELYNLKTDPNEKKNISKKNPKKTNELKKILEDELNMVKMAQFGLDEKGIIKAKIHELTKIKKI